MLRKRCTSVAPLAGVPRPRPSAWLPPRGPLSTPDPLPLPLSRQPLGERRTATLPAWSGPRGPPSLDGHGNRRWAFHRAPAAADAAAIATMLRDAPGPRGPALSLLRAAGRDPGAVHSLALASRASVFFLPFVLRPLLLLLFGGVIAIVFFFSSSSYFSKLLSLALSRRPFLFSSIFTPRPISRSLAPILCTAPCVWSTQHRVSELPPRPPGYRAIPSSACRSVHPSGRSRSSLHSGCV